MQPGAVPAVGVAIPPMHAGPGYDGGREAAYRALNMWGMLVMITGILALLSSIFAGIPAIVAGSIILCECCRGGSFLTRSSAGTVITLSIISAVISPAIMIAYIAIAIVYSTGAYIAPIIILAANTLASAVLASKAKKHRQDLPDFAGAVMAPAPDTILVAAPAPFAVPGGSYPVNYTGGYPQQQYTGGYPQQQYTGGYPQQQQVYGAPPPAGGNFYGAPPPCGAWAAGCGTVTQPRENLKGCPRQQDMVDYQQQ